MARDFKQDALTSCACVDSVFDVLARSLVKASNFCEGYWRVMVAYCFLEIKRRFSIINELIYEGMCIVPEIIQIVDWSIIEI